MTLAAGFAVFHWWMARVADNRLESIIAEWRADPEAPLPEMLLPSAGNVGVATGEDNAAFHYQQAMRNLPALNQRQRDEWDNAVGPQSPLPPEKAELVRQIVTAAAPQLHAAREARALETVDWNLPALGIMTIADWSGVRMLAIRLGWAMMLAHHDGDIGAAMEYGLDMAALSHGTGSYGPSLVAGLVSTGLHALAADRFIDTAWHRPPGMSDEEEQAAWREAAPQVRLAIEELLDDERVYEIMLLSWKGERVLGHNMLNTTPAVTGLPLGDGGVLSPIYKADMARLLERENQLIEDVESRDAARIFDTSRRLDGRLSPRSMAANASSLLTILAAPSLERGNIAFHRVLVQRHAAAVILASKLFYAEHGRWPTSLEELVPGYLPRMPQDPFAPPGTPMGFRSDGPLPIIYSVGEDLADDGGSTAPPLAASAEKAQRLRSYLLSEYERRDIVFPLYLPPESFQWPEIFNLWHYLEDPEAEIERAREEHRQRLEDESRAREQ
jgi:hypothetical protein